MATQDIQGLREQILCTEDANVRASLLPADTL